MVETLKAELRQRVTEFREELEQFPDDSEQLPGTHIVPLVLVIDDYEQITALTRNPLNDLKEFLLQARDLHLHLIVAGTPSDIMRTDPITQQCRMFRVGIVLGGDVNDPQVLGTKVGDRPPGRGTLVRRNQRNIVQIAQLAPDMLSPWIQRLAQTAAENATHDNTALLALMKEQQ